MSDQPAAPPFASVPESITAPDTHDKLQHYPDGTNAFIQHPSQARPGIHAYPDKLYVLTMLENPLRWRSRYQNYHNFERMCTDAGAILYTAEVAFENRSFEITDRANPRHLQLRAESEFWRKENVLNLLASRLPPECQKLATFDADIEFARRDWCQEILHQLAHYDVIQPFDSAVNLGSEDVFRSGPHPSFMYQYAGPNGFPPHAEEFLEDRDMRWTAQGVVRQEQDATGAYPGLAQGWHPGLAWAYRKSAWDTLGGLMDWLPTGSGDWHMANAFTGNLTKFVDTRHTESYKRNCQIWQDRAIKIRDNPEGGVGWMPGLLLHRFHGTHKNRQYEHRHKFVINVEFDPDLDLKRDSQGLWQLTGRNPKLRDGLRAYARMRDEDGR